MIALQKLAITLAVIRLDIFIKELFRMGDISHEGKVYTKSMLDDCTIELLRLKKHLEPSPEDHEQYHVEEPLQQKIAYEFNHLDDTQFRKWEDMKKQRDERFYRDEKIEYLRKYKSQWTHYKYSQERIPLSEGKVYMKDQYKGRHNIKMTQQRHRHSSHSLSSSSLVGLTLLSNTMKDSTRNTDLSTKRFTMKKTSIENHNNNNDDNNTKTVSDIDYLNDSDSLNIVHMHSNGSHHSSPIHSQIEKTHLVKDSNINTYIHQTDGKDDNENNNNDNEEVSITDSVTDLSLYFSNKLSLPLLSESTSPRSPITVSENITPSIPPSSSSHIHSKSQSSHPPHPYSIKKSTHITVPNDMSIYKQQQQQQYVKSNHKNDTRYDSVNSDVYSTEYFDIDNDTPYTDIEDNGHYFQSDKATSHDENDSRQTISTRSASILPKLHVHTISQPLYPPSSSSSSSLLHTKKTSQPHLFAEKNHHRDSRYTCRNTMSTTTASADRRGHETYTQSNDRKDYNREDRKYTPVASTLPNHWYVVKHRPYQEQISSQPIGPYIRVVPMTAEQYFNTNTNNNKKHSKNSQMKYLK